MPLFNALLAEVSGELQKFRVCDVKRAFSDAAATKVFNLSQIEKADAELFLVPASSN